MKANKCGIKQEYNTNWLSDEVYNKVNQEINSWPEWKKEAYNEMFGFSDHSRLVIVR